MIAPEHLELIRAAASARPVAEHIGVKLSRHGRGPCPLCKPSARSGAFTLSDDGRHWRCFRCNEHGDGIALACAALGLPFEPAARLVADLCGIAIDTPLSGRERDRIRAALADRRQRAVDAGRVAAWQARASREWNVERDLLRVARRIHGKRLRSGEDDAADNLARIADRDCLLIRNLDALASTDPHEVEEAILIFIQELEDIQARSAA